MEFTTPFIDPQGSIVSQRTCQVEIMHEHVDGGIDLEMALLPAGMYQMGSPERRGYSDEHPRHLSISLHFRLAGFRSPKDNG
jgi:hypothetical protein